MAEFRIIELCKRKGITQAQLAEKIGISRVGLSKALNGNTTIATLHKVAAALDVEVVDLFTVQSDFVALIRQDGKTHTFTAFEDLKKYVNDND